MIYRLVVKQIIDFLIALSLLIMVSPFLFIICVTIILTSRCNPFFVQPRPGKYGKTFSVIKLKTMNGQRDRNGKFLPDFERLTKIGKIIRSTSLDELPQLINVLKGDMSLVGPRPLLVKYLPLYSEKQARRHEVRPGITGWAQVNGRNALSWQQKFEYDVYYVENIGLYLDVKILLMTLYKVFRREGISSGTSQTMEPFMGNGRDGNTTN